MENNLKKKFFNFKNKKFLLIFIFLFLFFINYNSATTIGTNTIRGVILGETETTATANYSLINVNNSIFWQGHTGTDGSWLTGISTYNQTYEG